MGRGILACLCLALAIGAAEPVRAQVDSGVIRLGSRSPSTEAEVERGADGERPNSPAVEGRRGFDYEAFDSKLETLWFQRKAYLAAGRDAEVARQGDLIRAFCAEEGVRRLDGLAGALLAEAGRALDEGNHDRALRSLALAEALDPGRSQIHFARAIALRQSGAGIPAAAAEWLRGVRYLVERTGRNLVAGTRVALVLVVAILGATFLFSLLMVWRYQVAVRHEVEEWLQRRGFSRSASAGAWALLLLPLVLWIGAGWAVFYWIGLTFRFMRRGERIAATTLLLAVAATVPLYRVGIALHGLSADPVVRTTLAAVSGSYDPDRIVRLRQVVDAHPDDPTFRFLLAGLYKNGRYFEEAYEEYKRVLEASPGTFQAHVNIGNIFHLTGQYGEAVAHYRRALELEPRSVLAYYDMYLAQSEAFRFKEADEALARGQAIDAEEMARLLSQEGREGGRSRVVDATIEIGSVWQATFEGRALRDWMQSQRGRGALSPIPEQFLNPLSVAAALTLCALPFLMLASHRHAPARRCIRCGRPFCRWCKSGREAREYCSQCVHLFVLGDGLAPETKTRKLYEVERYERLNRRIGRLVSLLLPGAGHLMRGRAVIGVALMTAWVLALVAWRPSALLPVESFLGSALGIEVLEGASVPAMFHVDAAGLGSLLLAVIVWVVANMPRLRLREA